MSDIVALEFRSPRSKLARARHHLASLDAEMVAYASRVSGQLEIRRLTTDDGDLYRRAAQIAAQNLTEAETGEARSEGAAEAYIHRLRMSLPPLDSINVIAADAVQNLRQSLDHAACSCARAIGKTDSSVWFPLVASGKDMDAAIKDKARKLPASIQQIMKLAAPPGGTLYGLHEVGMEDKHRTICTVDCDAAPDFQRLAAGPGWIASGFGAADWDEKSTSVNVAISSSPAERDYNFSTTVGIKFRAGSALAGQEVVETLNNIADAIDSIIREMEREMTRLLCAAGAA